MATTFTVGAGNIMRPYRYCRVQHFPEAASQTFVRGDILIMDAASTENRVKIAAAQPVTLIVGVAAADASGVTGTMVPVWLATQQAEFLIVGKAAQAMDFTDLSVGLAVARDATNKIWTVDNTDTTHDAVVPLTILAPATQGDFQGYYVVRFAAAASLWIATV
jgi:hypothetical protein